MPKLLNPRGFSAKNTGIFLMSYLFAVGALIAVRAQIVLDLGWSRSKDEGLFLGVIFDALVLILAFVIGFIFNRISTTFSRLVWTLGLWFLYLTSLANTLYYMFFKSNLQWWVVVQHFSDTAVVGDVGLEMALTPALVLSLVLVVTATYFGFRSLGAPIFSGFLRNRFLGFAMDAVLGLSIGTLAVETQQWPRRHRIKLKKMLQSPYDVLFLKSPVVFVPFIDWLPAVSGRAVTVMGEFNNVSIRNLRPEEKKNPSAVLKAFQDKDSASIGKYLDKQFPLLQDFRIEKDIQKEWRDALGFSANAKLSTVFLFAESLRSFELVDPKIGPLLYPRLTEIFQEHGIYLTRGYTSAFSAGQTVRGMWQTFCSVLPNILGPAPFLSNPKIGVDCLPQDLANAGYRTSMFLATTADYHNKRAFEELHGTQIIRDKFDYDRENSRTWTGWGVPDDRYFKHLLKFIEEEAARPEPFFVQGINTNTHAPFTFVPGADRPIGWDKRTRLRWGKYHASFHRFDDELADFIEAYLKSDAANEGYLVVAGDHSTGWDVPPDFVRGHREVEVRFRVPVIFISKFLKKPIRIDKAFHAIDVGLTIATINELERPVIRRVHMGRALRPSSRFRGSNWVFVTTASELHYRADDRSCYTLRNRKSDGMVCYKDGGGEDPLFDKELQFIPEDLEMTKFFNKVVEADFLAVSLDRLKPRDKTSLNQVTSPKAGEESASASID